ncbi:MAG: hypothetical protein F2663_05345 [Actinobacteria bacterium]|uniref:Unannotated protein n=1 Tax=freshwater metagenome TaxID=449393 RepID=A0A6J6PB91_9ZZZZ|nr:hypothetical protein [Actinomycetota bacterium]
MPGVRRLTVNRRAVAIIATAAVAAQLIVAVAHLPSLAMAGGRAYDTKTPAIRDGDLDPLALYAGTQALVLARAAIPPSATFAVAIGNDPPVAQPEVLRRIFDFWLAPRRDVGDPAKADWVIVYHRSSESVGVPYTTEAGLGPDGNAIKVSHPNTGSDS